jgi:hypothetical protein
LNLIFDLLSDIVKNGQFAVIAAEVLRTAGKDSRAVLSPHIGRLASREGPFCCNLCLAVSGVSGFSQSTASSIELGISEMQKETLVILSDAKYIA